MCSVCVRCFPTVITLHPYTHVCTHTILTHTLTQTAVSLLWRCATNRNILFHVQNLSSNTHTYIHTHTHTHNRNIHACTHSLSSHHYSVLMKLESVIEDEVLSLSLLSLFSLSPYPPLSPLSLSPPPLFFFLFFSISLSSLFHLSLSSHLSLPLFLSFPHRKRCIHHR